MNVNVDYLYRTKYVKDIDIYLYIVNSSKKHDQSFFLLLRNSVNEYLFICWPD